MDHNAPNKAQLGPACWRSKIDLSNKKKLRLLVVKKLFLHLQLILYLKKKKTFHPSSIASYKSTVDKGPRLEVEIELGTG